MRANTSTLHYTRLPTPRPVHVLTSPNRRSQIHTFSPKRSRDDPPPQHRPLHAPRHGTHERQASRQEGRTRDRIVEQQERRSICRRGRDSTRIDGQVGESEHGEGNAGGCRSSVYRCVSGCGKEGACKVWWPVVRHG